MMNNISKIFLFSFLTFMAACQAGLMGVTDPKIPLDQLNQTELCPKLCNDKWSKQAGKSAYFLNCRCFDGSTKRASEPKEDQEAWLPTVADKQCTSECQGKYTTYEILKEWVCDCD